MRRLGVGRYLGDDTWCLRGTSRLTEGHLIRQPRSDRPSSSRIYSATGATRLQSPSRALVLPARRAGCERKDSARSVHSWGLLWGVARGTGETIPSMLPEDTRRVPIRIKKHTGPLVRVCRIQKTQYTIRRNKSSVSHPSSPRSGDVMWYAL